VLLVDGLCAPSQQAELWPDAYFRGHAWPPGLESSPPPFAVELYSRGLDTYVWAEGYIIRGPNAGTLMRAAIPYSQHRDQAFAGATEDFPWGERVVKVSGKVFVFLGMDPVPGGAIGLSVKLPESGPDALDLPFAKPTGYGLGKSGWVSAHFEPGEDVPVDLLKQWIDESHAAIAPKRAAVPRRKKVAR
jgi:predicted DNA-binding protein (MmcQ/YjbR family)